MNSTNSENHISKITTNWEMIRVANLTLPETGESVAISSAQFAVLKSYAGCVFNYFLGATRNNHVAEDLSQEFALRLVRGDFRNANPQRGRFRDYLKTALRNMVNDHYRKLKRTEEAAIPANIEKFAGKLDSEFESDWRKQAIGLAWQALQHFEKKHDNFYYTVLRIRVKNPEASSKALAQQFCSATSQEVSADWVRQNLRRARKKFCELLTNEVAKTLQTSDPDQIQNEFARLNLLKYLEH